MKINSICSLIRKKHNEKELATVVEKLFLCNNFEVEIYDNECIIKSYDQWFELAYDGEMFTVQYWVEHGPLDFYFSLRNERDILFGFGLLKHYFDLSPFYSCELDYPTKYIKIGYSADFFENEFLIDFFECCKVITNMIIGSGYVSPNADIRKTESIISNMPFNGLDISDLLNLRYDNDFIKTFLLYTNDYNKIIESFNCDSITSFKLNWNEKFKIMLSEEMNFDYRLNDNYKELELKIQKAGYLVLESKHNKSLFVVTDIMYDKLHEWSSKEIQTLDSYCEERFYINNDFELIIDNSFFIGVQNAYQYDLDKINNILRENKFNVDLLFKHKEILEEFENLINDETISERRLEEYISKHFKLILGIQYEKIDTQVIINNDYALDSKDRRLDIFAYDSKRDDWDLYELKKPSIKSVSYLRDIPKFSSSVNDGISQLEHYHDLLRQKQVKDDLGRKYKIDYKNIDFYLIVGKEYSDDFRMLANRRSNIKIVCYQQLYDRLENMYMFIESQTGKSESID